MHEKGQIMSSTKQHQIIIIGGSFTGMIAALALKQQGFDVALIERRPEGTQEDITLDGRGHAIASAGQRFFVQLGLWQQILPYAAPIEHIRITDSKGNSAKPSISPLQMQFHGLNDQSNPQSDQQQPMGWITENSAVRGILYRATKAALGENFIEGLTVETIDRQTTHITLKCRSGESFHGSLLLGCDGRGSIARKLAKIKLISWSYNQEALVCCLNHELPHKNWAYEHFTPQGPFAVLPLPDSPQGQPRSTLVWANRPERTQQLARMNDEDLAAQMTEVFGPWLGAIRPQGQRWVYPLSAQHARDYIAVRLALVGDAAHGIHPIAGQGFNLALRDIQALLALLIQARRYGQDLGDYKLLSDYQRQRRADNTFMLFATDALDKTFSNNLPVLRHARGLGLAALERMPRLKARFIRYAMGEKIIGR